MTVNLRFGSSGAARGPSLERAAAAIINTLLRVAEQCPSPVLWPEAGTSSVEVEQRREWSRELEGYFREMRTCARDTDGPETLLPMFEGHLVELEATMRGAIAGRGAAFLSIHDFIRQVEDFQKRWGPYIDPPPAPPPRVQFDEGDRSFWVDGRRVATGLTRDEFEYLKALARAHPNILSWRRVTNTVPGFHGKNQSRFKRELPEPVRELIEATPTGSVLRLPANSSTGV